MNQSCKDYDDDIENLQGQITSNAQAIAELQKLIGDGNFVKSVVASADGIVVTMSNGTSTPITIKGEAGKAGSVVEIADNGEITIDGKGTGFFAAKSAATGKIQMPYINEEGELITFDKEGKEVKTGIKKNAVVAVKNTDGSYTLTVPGADGKPMTIKLPSAASAINAAELTITSSAAEQLELEAVTFKLSGAITKATEWGGTKNVAEQVFVNNNAAMKLTIAPAAVDGTALTYTLVNAKGETAKDVTFTATKAADGSASSRAVNSAEYNLTMNAISFATNDAYKEWDKQFGTANAPVKYALSANGNIITDYVISFKAAAPSATAGSSKYTKAFAPHIVKSSVKPVKGVYDWNNYLDAKTVDLNETYKLISTIPGDAIHEDLYDMYYTVSDTDKELFGVVAGEEENTFKVTKENNGKLTINLFAVDKAGKVVKTTCSVSLSTKIDTPATYETIEHAIVPNKGEAGATAEKNFFTVDLAAMKTSLAGKLTQWNKDADHIITTITLAADGSSVAKASDAFGAEGQLLAKLDATKPASPENANFIKFVVTNKTATGAKLAANTLYNLNIQFQTLGGAELNTIVVPVKFSIPTVASQFKFAETALVKDNVIQAYMFDESAAKVSLADFFGTYPTATGISSLDKKKVVVKTPAGVEYTQDALFQVSTTSLATAELSLKLATVKGINFAYGLTTTLTATVADYLGWAYNADPSKGAIENEYKFDIRLLSPIKEGSVALVEGTVLTVKATEGSAKLYGEAFKAVDYKDVPYSIVPSAKANEYINVTFGNGSKSEKGYLSLSTQAYKAPVAADKDKGIEAEAEVKGAFVATLVDANKHQTDVEDSFTVVVTDDWGFIHTVKVPVKILAK